MKNIITSICFCFAMASQAQSISNNVIASGGTTLTSGNVTLEYTVGETFTNTLSSTNNSITQGFHQPNILVARMASNEAKNESEIGNETADKQITDNSIAFHFDVYPNPATDFVNVRINEIPESKCVLILSDETGRVITSKQISDVETQIDFTQLASGKYFITVKTEDGKVKESFKVIKVN